MQIRSVYKKFDVIRVVKIINNWKNIDIYKSKRQQKALNVKVNYAYKAYGQKFIDYLGPTIYIIY